MSDEPNSSTPKKRSVGADLIIPLSAIVFTLYYFSTIIDSPWTAQATAFFVGATLIGLCLVFVGIAAWQLITGESEFSLRALIEPIAILPRKAALMALTLASIIAIPWLGFTLTSLVFLSLSILLLSGGKNVVFTISLSVGLAVIWFIIFVLIFKRRFPLGWLDDQITTLIKPLLHFIGLG